MSWFKRKSTKTAPRTDIVPSPSAQPCDLPQLVLVSGTPSKVPELPGLTQAGLTLGVYSSDQALTPDFRTAFRIGQPGVRTGLNPPFQHGVLYRRHLDSRKALYYPFYEFDHAMGEAKYNELLDIAQHIKAHVVLIDGTTLAEAHKERERGLNVFAPVASAGGIGAGILGSSDLATVGAGGSSTKATGQTHERGFLVCFEAQEPEPGSFLPPGDVIPEGWYFYNLDNEHGGFKGTQFAKLVATAMQGDYGTKTLEVNFAAEDHSLAARIACFQAGAKLLAAFADRADTDRTASHIAGVGFSHANVNLQSRRVHYKFKVEMFDREVYAKLKRLSRTEQTDMNERIRRSSGHTATLRWMNYRIQPMVREDLRFIGATVVPSGETNQRRGPWCFGDYVRGVLDGDGNYVNIPITVYGLQGEGKSSVLGTWFSSARDSPYTFVDKTHMDFRDRVTDDSWRWHVADSIITDIKFESANVGREAEGHELSQEWDSVNGNAVIERPGTVRLVMRDTAPAVSPKEDERGRPLPDGLLVLVIDATEVDKSSDAKRWVELVPGKNYPPVACILAKTNTFTEERVEQMTKWVQNQLGIKHVIPMRTFSVLSVDERRGYLDAEVMSLERHAFNADWKKTCMSALQALEALLEVIKSIETAGIEMVLAKESESFWWPFAFTSSMDAKKHK